MTTATAPAPAEMPSINLDPNAAEQRKLVDIYRIKQACYEYASDDYVAKRTDGVRPLQLSIEWEALSFRFEDNPDTNPILKRGINVTDKNGNPTTWGDPNNPEPTSDDAFPIQLSKHFAKCGVSLTNDPHVLDGLCFTAERKKMKAGKTEVDAIIPIELFTGEYTGEVRIVKGREQGQAGNPATGSAPASTGPTKEAALAALAEAMVGKTAADLVNVALENATVQGNGDVLAMAAQGAPAVEALKALGTWDAKGVYAKA